MTPPPNPVDPSVDTLDPLHDDAAGAAGFVPLIDVLFSVLAAVMACLALAEPAAGRLPVRLPQVAAATSTNGADSVSVTFDGDGGLQLDGQDVTLEALPAALRARHGGHRQVVLRGDRGADYARFAVVLAAVGQSAPSSVVLATDPTR